MCKCVTVHACGVWDNNNQVVIIYLATSNDNEDFHNKINDACTKYIISQIKFVFNKSNTTY